MSAGIDPNGILFMATSERIALGVLNRTLLPLLERWYNDLTVSRTLGVNWHPITTRMKRRHLDDLLTSGAPIFTIYDRASQQPIGISGLEEINHADGTAEFMILIGDGNFRGAGYGTEATRLTLNYAFDVLGLYNVWLQVSANNPGAIRAYEKAGFQLIGVRRRSVRIGRELVGDVYMDAIADDFEPSALAGIMHPPKESR